MIFLYKYFHVLRFLKLAFFMVWHLMVHEKLYHTFLSIFLTVGIAPMTLNSVVVDIFQPIATVIFR